MTRFNSDRRDLLKGVALSGAAATFGNLTISDLLNAAPTAGTTLTVGIPGVPATIDPMYQINHDWMMTNQLIFENLVEFDIDGELKPQLAKELPKISADGLTYDFALREDVKFQNGQPFTAEDVKYSFDFLMDPANKTVRRPIFIRIKEVTVVSPYQVRVTLTEPHAPWLAYLTKCMGIFPKGSREKNSPEFFRMGPIGMGTGPAIFEEWRQNEYISFVRNPNYWRKGTPGWERLVIRQLPDDSARVAYLRSGQIDVLSAPPPREFERLKSVPGLHTASRPTLGGWFNLYIDNAKAPFDDVNVRRAISSAIDRDLIAKNIYRGLLDPTAIPAPKNSWWYNASADKAAGFDLERAKKFMAASKHASGTSIEIAIPSASYLLDVRDAALVLQQQLKAINIDVKLNVMEFGPMIQAILRGEIPASLWLQMSPGEPSYLMQTVLTPDTWMTKSANYQNTEIVGMLKRVYMETDRAKLKPIFDEIQTLLAKDCPSIWIGFAHAANVWRDRVKNFVPNQGLTLDVRNVKLT